MQKTAGSVLASRDATNSRAFQAASVPLAVLRTKYKWHKWHKIMHNTSPPLCTDRRAIKAGTSSNSALATKQYVRRLVLFLVKPSVYLYLGRAWVAGTRVLGTGLVDISRLILPLIHTPHYILIGKPFVFLFPFFPLPQSHIYFCAWHKNLWLCIGRPSCHVARRPELHPQFSLAWGTV